METGIYGWRARLGYAGPSPLSNTPYEFWRMAPDGIAMVSTGLHIPREFNGDLDEAVKEVSDAIRALDPFGLDRISIGLADFIYLRGSDALRDIRSTVSTIGTLPIFFDVEAVIEAAHALRATRLIVLSPYEKATNKGIKAYFKEAGLDVAEVISHPTASPLLNDGRLENAIVDAVAGSKAQALYIAGDAWPVAKDIAAIEHKLHVPLITEAQALLWSLLRQLHIRSLQANYGRLLAN